MLERPSSLPGLFLELAPLNFHFCSFPMFNSYASDVLLSLLSCKHVSSPAERTFLTVVLQYFLASHQAAISTGS